MTDTSSSPARSAEEIRFELFLKSAEVNALRASNDILADQLKGRWSGVEWWMKVMGIAITVVFGYQVWKAAEITAASLKLEQITQQNTALQADGSVVSNASTQICGLLSAGYYDVGRLQYRRALVSAENAAAVADTALKSVKDEKLRASLETLRRSCLSLQARCCYSLKDYDTMRTVAEVLLLTSTGEDRWAGYHFRGLYQQAKSATSAEALKAFHDSLGCKPKYNIDLFNVIELELALCEFDEVIKWTAQYAAEFPEHDRGVAKGEWDATPVSVADVYARVARVVKKMNGADVELRKAIEQIKLRNVSLGKSGWDPTALADMQDGLFKCPAVTALSAPLQALIKEAFDELMKAHKRQP